MGQGQLEDRHEDLLRLAAHARRVVQVQDRPLRVLLLPRPLHCVPGPELQEARALLVLELAAADARQLLVADDRAAERDGGPRDPKSGVEDLLETRNNY